MDGGSPVGSAKLSSGCLATTLLGHAIERVTRSTQTKGCRCGARAHDAIVCLAPRATNYCKPMLPQAAATAAPVLRDEVGRGARLGEDDDEAPLVHRDDAVKVGVACGGVERWFLGAFRNHRHDVECFEGPHMAQGSTSGANHARACRAIEAASRSTQLCRTGTCHAICAC